jgi:hypothetical protein
LSRFVADSSVALPYTPDHARGFLLRPGESARWDPVEQHASPDESRCQSVYRRWALRPYASRPWADRSAVLGVAALYLEALDEAGLPDDEPVGFRDSVSVADSVHQLDPLQTP